MSSSSKFSFIFTSEKLEYYIWFCKSNGCLTKNSEEHHIYPRAIFGENDITVSLTPYNHLKAHYLLVEALKNQPSQKDNFIKMNHALFWMCNTRQVNDENLDEFCKIYEESKVLKRELQRSGGNQSAKPVNVFGVEYGCKRDAQNRLNLSFGQITELSKLSDIKEQEKRLNEIKQLSDAHQFECVVEGVNFKSIKSAAAHFKVGRYVIEKYLSQNGRVPLVDITNRVKHKYIITIGSKEYKSFADASRETGVSIYLIRKYLKEHLQISFEEYCKTITLN